MKQLQQLKKNFISELLKGQDGGVSSLPFICHNLSTTTIVKVDEMFQTLVIGGSYYQNATFKRYADNIMLCEHEAGEQPPFLSEDDLMRFLEQHIDPTVTVIALNFAYPLKPVVRGEILDGVLQSGSKENTFTGLVGKTVGERIEQYFLENRGQKLTVSSANDTICLLLSGLMTHEWDEIAAGIVGTGLNFALFIDNTTAVNLESANFDKFEQSNSGKVIDEKSVAPGKSLYEKEVSGAYLFRHFNIMAKKEGLEVPEIHSTKEIDALAKSDNKDVAKLARSIVTKSAHMVAAQIAGIMEFCERDLTFIMQGSLYWRGWQYKELVEEKVRELSPKYKARYEQVLHSDLYGAAKLVAK